MNSFGFADETSFQSNGRLVPGLTRKFVSVIVPAFWIAVFILHNAP